MPIGSAVLVPLAGGSGGGGAYSTRGESAGGGGGGALSLYSFRTLELYGEIHADGGDGVTEQSAEASGGGGGSGGAVIVGAQGGVIVGPDARITAMGGNGGEAKPEILPTTPLGAMVERGVFVWTDELTTLKKLLRLIVLV